MENGKGLLNAFLNEKLKELYFYFFFYFQAKCCWHLATLKVSVKFLCGNQGNKISIFQDFAATETTGTTLFSMDEHRDTPRHGITTRAVDNTCREESGTDNKPSLDRPRQNSQHKQLSRLPLESTLSDAEGRLKETRTIPSNDIETITATYVDAKSSRKILQLAKEQLEEITAEDETKSNDTDTIKTPQPRIPEVKSTSDSSEDKRLDRADENGEDHAVEPAEALLFEKYLGHEGESSYDSDSQPTLADKIMEKIRQQENGNAISGISQGEAEDEEEEGVMLPQKVIQVYTQVGDLLSRYRSGKLPRAFKIIPSLQNWEDVLYVTQPEAWSVQAVYEATNMFISMLSVHQAQTFVSIVLLERFKAELDPNAPSKPGSGPKTLNYHVFRALKKSLYKPAAFFKGFLFPLAESGSCTMREATIASSIMTQTSIPALHSAAALLRLTEFEYYSGPISTFIKVLLEKKYALPFKAVDSVVFHFLRFKATTNKDSEKILPVIWHQTFLVFVQHYKNDITEDQRDALLEVLKVRKHAAITSEIRRELLSGAARSAQVPAQVSSQVVAS